MGKPQNWRERPGRDPEQEATRLRQRFSAITRRYEQRVASGKGRRAAARWEKTLGIASVVAIVLGLLWLSRGHGLQ
jgi:hypothetical protein